MLVNRDAAACARSGNLVLMNNRCVHVDRLSDEFVGKLPVLPLSHLRCRSRPIAG
jgi:hypothetical protein